MQQSSLKNYSVLNNHLVANLNEIKNLKTDQKCYRAVVINSGDYF